MARVTSQDVARAAGVSQTTVSFVLNGRTDQGISERTRAAVLEAIDRLGYVPSAAARSLRNGHSNVVLCAFPALPPAQAIEVFKEHLTSAFREAGYACVFVQIGEGAFSDVWRHVHPAAVISMTTLSEADAAALDRAAVPVLDGVLDPTRPDAALDQSDVGHLQVTHLHDRGHTRIGFAAIDHPLETPFNGPRVAGAQRACAELGLEPPLVVEMDYTRAAAERGVATWTAAGVTGVAAFNDLSAISTMAACRAAGLTVPDDLAVIGVDDLPVSALVDPGLSSVALDLRAPARVMATRILDGLRGQADSRPAPLRLPLALVQRDST